MSDWMGTRETAAYLGRSPKAIAHLVARGTLPAWTYRRLGRRYLFRRVWLDAWLTDGDKSRRTAGLSG